MKTGASLIYLKPEWCVSLVFLFASCLGPVGFKKSSTGGHPFWGGPISEKEAAFPVQNSRAVAIL